MDGRRASASPQMLRRKSARGGSMDSPDASPGWERALSAKNALDAIGEMRTRASNARSPEQVDEALEMLNTHLREGMMGPTEFGGQFDYLWGLKMQHEGKVLPASKHGTAIRGFAARI